MADARPAAPFRADLAGAPAGTRAVWARAGTVRLRVVLSPPGPRGTALLLPGRTEYAEKYGPMMARFAALGLGSAVIDWRGQGLSDRPEGAGNLGHVGDFSEYQQDVAALLALPELQACPGPRLVLSHSMGGAIALRAFQEGLLTGPGTPPAPGGTACAGAVFVAPMWGLNLPRPALVLSRHLACVATRLGRGRRPIPRGTEIPYVLEQPFEGNVFTGDAAQYRTLVTQVTEAPGLGLGAPTWGWLNAALREIRRLGPLPGPDLPVLGFVGTAEQVVSVPAIRTRMGHWPGARLVDLPEAGHEPSIERAPIRAKLWEEIGAFLDRVMPATG